MKAVIYHNPRCSKSRATLSLLNERDVEVEIVRYLETPPSAEQLAGLLRKLSVAAPQIIRFKEKAARELGLTASDQRDEGEWLELIAANPTLLERPIVTVGNQAAIGRPPENVLAIL